MQKNKITLPLHSPPFANGSLRSPKAPAVRGDFYTEERCSLTIILSENHPCVMM